MVPVFFRGVFCFCFFILRGLFNLILNFFNFFFHFEKYNLREIPEVCTSSAPRALSLSLSFFLSCGVPQGWFLSPPPVQRV